MRGRTRTQLRTLGFPPLAGLLVLVVALAACGDSETVVGGAAESEDSSGLLLDGRQFWSVSVLEDGVERSLVEGTRISLRFDNGNIGASAGCNSMGGPYQVDDNQQLTATEMAITEMGCDPERHAQDEFVAAILTAHPRLTISGDHLTLATDTVTIEFLDTDVADPDRPLIGTHWTVTGFIQGGNCHGYERGPRSGGLDRVGRRLAADGVRWLCRVECAH